MIDAEEIWSFMNDRKLVQDYCNLVQKFRTQAQATSPSIRTDHK
jgi:hypothetical protein